MNWSTTSFYPATKLVNMNGLSSTQPPTMPLTSSLGHLAEMAPGDSGEVMTPTFYGANSMTTTTYQYPDIGAIPNVVENIPIVTPKKATMHQNPWDSVVGHGVLSDLCHEANGGTNGLKEMMNQFLSPPSQEVNSSEYPNLIIAEDLFGDDMDGNVSCPQGMEYKIEQFINMPEEVTTTAPVKIVALKCSKKKNPSYLIEEEGKDIFTKDQVAVKFQTEGAKPGYTVWATLRFVDSIMMNTSVKACPLHARDESNCLPHSREFSFYSSHCKYVFEDGHPTVCIPVRFDDKGNALEFYLAFICLNSCHKSKGKLIDLWVTLKDDEGNLVKKQTFSLRVCKNVKRDRKEVKRSIEEPAQSVRTKVVKREPEAVVAANPLPCVPTAAPLPSPLPQAVQEEAKEFFLLEASPSALEKFMPLFGSMDVKVHPFVVHPPDSTKHQ